MTQIARIIGPYVSGWGSASGNWNEDIVKRQIEALPSIGDMCTGTFNLKLICPNEFVPNDIEAIRKVNPGSCISRTTKVTRINDVTTEAYIYNGGWPSDTLELISKVHIAKEFELNLNDVVTVELEINS